jgi:hypothetical protein
MEIQFATYGSQTPVVLFKVDSGQYAPKGHAAYIGYGTIRMFVKKQSLLI